MKHNCPLCSTESPSFFKQTYSCPICFLVFKSAELFLSSEDESKRYHTHQNANNDQGYIDFLNKLGTPLRSFLKPEDHLLDYGCGPFSQLAKNLESDVLTTSFYDPLFFPNENIKNKQFDVVTCTEVVEHFKAVSQDWDQLVATVKPKGILGIMTQFYHDDINFKDWWYKNDPTHIVFYREETLAFLAKKYQMKVLYNDHRSVIIFQNG
jgi:hypothetical protein